MNDLGMSELHDKTKAFKIEPKPKEQVLVELRELKERLGLHQTSGDMNMTHSIVKRVGSLTELWSEMRESKRYTLIPRHFSKFLLKNKRVK